MKFKKILKIENINEKKDVYNISCFPNQNYFANGILVHNCDSHITFGRKVRFRSPSNVFLEFKECVDKFGIYHFGLLDDTTTLNKKRWIKICEAIKKLDVKYHCATRVDCVDEELLKAMKSSGCYRIHVGVESGNEAILNRLGKAITLRKIEECFKLCRKVGMSTYAYFVLGAPGETEETIEQTIDFARKLNPDYAQFTILMPFPGTDLYRWVEENKLFLENVDYHDYRWYGQPVFKENIDPERLIQLQKKAYKKFYQRPKYIAKYIVKHLRLLDLKEMFRDFMKFRRWIR